MKPSRISFYVFVVLIFLSGFLNQPLLWSLTICSLMAYLEFRISEVKKELKVKDESMGIRLIDGMKALTALCQNAFDHIKSINVKIDRTDRKLNENAVKIHRLEQRSRQAVVPRSPYPPELYKKPEALLPKPVKKKE